MSVKKENVSPMYYWNEKRNCFATHAILVSDMKRKYDTTESKLTEEDFEAFVKKESFIPITYSMAKEFYRDLVGTAKAKEAPPLGDTEEVAELMRITIDKAQCYLLSCAHFSITERQGGFWIYEE